MVSSSTTTSTPTDSLMTLVRPVRSSSGIASPMRLRLLEDADLPLAGLAAQLQHRLEPGAALERNENSTKIPTAASSDQKERSMP
jgi:hypothetical protein